MESETHYLYLNSSCCLTKVYGRFVDSINQAMRGTEGFEEFDFEQLYINDRNFSLMADVFNTLAISFCLAYQKGQVFMQDQIKTIEEEITKCKIMNTFLLFGILKQTNYLTHNEISLRAGESLLRNVTTEIMDAFCKYIMTNYASIKLSYLEVPPKIWTQEEMEQYREE